MQYGALILADQQLVLAKAIDGAVLLDQQLNKLLDLFDFYVERYPADTPTTQLELTDLSVSIKELGTIPRLIALNLAAWRHGTPPVLSREGFEQHALSEFELHLFALHTFFQRKGLDTSGYSPVLVNDSMAALRLANKLLCPA
jgi:hypothetical protein